MGSIDQCLVIPPWYIDEYCQSSFSTPLLKDPFHPNKTE